MDPYSHWGVDEADTSLVGQRLVSSKQLLRRFGEWGHSYHGLNNGQLGLREPWNVFLMFCDFFIFIAIRNRNYRYEVKYTDINFRSNQVP
jgi:hypothetical protein